MMGRQPHQQQKMFYDRINLDPRIRSDHVLRQIAQHLDLDFIFPGEAPSAKELRLQLKETNTGEVHLLKMKL